MIDLTWYSNLYWSIISVGYKVDSRQRPSLCKNCVDQQILLQLLLHFLFHYSHSTCPSANCHIDISAQCLWMHYRSAVDEAEGLWLPKADLSLAHLWAIPEGKKWLCQLWWSLYPIETLGNGNDVKPPFVCMTQCLWRRLNP